jgi:DNA-directed RNA polymerase subunit RPC12/RpoP
MATERHDRGYGERTLVRVITVIGALMFVGVFAIPTVIEPPKITPIGYAILAIWGLVLVVGTVWTCRVQYRYHCSKCGAHLPPLPSEAKTKHQHRFHCKACDVIWTTDVYVGDA